MNLWLSVPKTEALPGCAIFRNSNYTLAFKGIWILVSFLKKRCPRPLDDKGKNIIILLRVVSLMVEYSAFNRKVLGSIPRQPIIYFYITETTGFEPASSPRQGVILSKLKLYFLKKTERKGFEPLNIYIIYIYVKLAIWYFKPTQSPLLIFLIIYNELNQIWTDED